MTRGRTAENRANLAPAFLEQIVKRYQGTRLGRQELDAELLDDVPGALWSAAIIEAARTPACRELPRIVVAIDPAVASGEHADETGIIVAGTRCRRARLCAGRRIGPLCAGRMGARRDRRLSRPRRRPHRRRDQQRRRDGRGDAAHDRPERAVPRGAGVARQGRARRAGSGAVRAGAGAPRRRVPAARRPDVRVRPPADFDRPTAGYSPDRVDALVWAFTELLVEPHAGDGIFETYRRLAARTGPAHSGRRTEGSKGGSMTLLVKDANTTVQSLATAARRQRQPGAAARAGRDQRAGRGNAGRAAKPAAGHQHRRRRGERRQRHGRDRRQRPDPVRRHRPGRTGSWCRTTRRPRCGSRMSGPRRPAARAFRSPPMAASSRPRQATSRPARSASTARRPARPLRRVAGERDVAE